MEKRIIREYEVYHRLMRNAQVYTEDSSRDYIDLEDEEHDWNWRDFEEDPLVDIVYAESEDEAVKIVEKDTGYHESNLYVMEHVVDVKTKVSNGKSLRFEASCYNDGILCGIEVKMPDGNMVLICNDKSDGRNKIIMGDNVLFLRNEGVKNSVFIEI